MSGQNEANELHTDAWQSYAIMPRHATVAAAVTADRFHNMPLWGQFLSRHGGVRKDAVTLSARRVRDQNSVDDLAQCFPLQLLAVSAPVDVFYEFYA
ncbi:hypothetical protein RI103_35680 [Paraburkholderia sp. FT54]|uniref:hypothetical protein n=1 Tax=Paraburkholderia sp. FT54 TaxID=3074437 RepID=UPI0028778D21|nr:hypothetical protein [Paraburkholderia sp. FT54]WNC94498.1 hypothetical protein RI103_35680 [Paraburkholderia sp. FT54]